MSFVCESTCTQECRYSNPWSPQPTKSNLWLSRDHPLTPPCSTVTNKWLLNLFLKTQSKFSIAVLAVSSVSSIKIAAASADRHISIDRLQKKRGHNKNAGLHSLEVPWHSNTVIKWRHQDLAFRSWQAWWTVLECIWQLRYWVRDGCFSSTYVSGDTFQCPLRHKYLNRCLLQELDTPTVHSLLQRDANSHTEAFLCLPWIQDLWVICFNILSGWDFRNSL